MNMLTRTLAAAIAAALLSTAALAHEVTVGALELSDLWTRATPPGAPTAAGYLTIANNGGEVDRLIAVSTPHAARGEIHEMAVTDGVMTMKPVDGIGIAPGESVTLAPGGLHLMFMGLTEPLTAGGIMAVTLTFEKAGSVETYLHVVAVGAFAPEGEPEHGSH
jgi:periplasmic copper chaperone A